jgi:hypothetical protein
MSTGASGIYKYSLPWPSSEAWRVTLSMPEGAWLLSVQEQHGQLVLWAFVDPSRPAVERRLRMCMTGEPIAAGFLAGAVHLATLQLRGGQLVVHVFEEAE